MNTFLHRSRGVSLSVAYFLVYTQIFGSFQGNHPLDLSKWFSQIEWSGLLMPSAYAEDSPQQQEQRAGGKNLKRVKQAESDVANFVKQATRSADNAERLAEIAGVVSKINASGKEARGFVKEAKAATGVATKSVAAAKVVLGMGKTEGLVQGFVKQATRSADNAERLAEIAGVVSKINASGKEARGFVEEAKAATGVATKSVTAAKVVSGMGKTEGLVQGFVKQATRSADNATQFVAAAQEVFQTKTAQAEAKDFVDKADKAVAEATAAQAVAETKQSVIAARAAYEKVRDGGGIPGETDAAAQALKDAESEAAAAITALAAAERAEAGSQELADAVSQATTAARTAADLAAQSKTTAAGPLLRFDHASVSRREVPRAPNLVPPQLVEFRYVNAKKERCTVVEYGDPSSTSTPPAKISKMKCQPGHIHPSAESVFGDGDNFSSNDMNILASAVEANNALNIDRRRSPFGFQSGDASITGELGSADLGSGETPEVKMVTDKGKLPISQGSVEGRKGTITRIKEGDRTTGVTGTSQKIFYNDDAVAQLQPEGSSEVMTKRTFLTNEEAAKFIAGATLAYNNARRFIYGTSSISSIIYKPMDVDEPYGIYKEAVAQLEKSDNPQANWRNPFKPNVHGRRMVDRFTPQAWSSGKLAPHTTDNQADFDAVVKYFFGDAANPSGQQQQEYLPPDVIAGKQGEKSYYGAVLCSQSHSGFPSSGTFNSVSGSKTYLVLKTHADGPDGCESLKRDDMLGAQADKRGDIYWIDAAYGCSEVLPSGSSSCSTSSTGPKLSIKTIAVGAANPTSKIKVAGLTCTKNSGVCSVPSIVPLTAGTDLTSGTPATAAISLCPDSQLPIELIYGGHDLGYGNEDKVGPGHDYFFWVQTKYPSREFDDPSWWGAYRDLNEPEGPQRDPCSPFDKTGAQMANPAFFRVLGVSKDSINYIAKMSTNNDYGQFKKYSVGELQTVFRDIDTRSSALEFGYKNSHDGFLHSLGSSAELAGNSLITNSFDYRHRAWLYTGLRAREIAMLEYYAYKQSLLAKIRGILPVVLNEDERFKYDSGSSIPLPMILDVQPFDRITKLQWDTNDATAYRLFAGPMHWVGNKGKRQTPKEFDKKYLKTRGLQDWLVHDYGPFANLPKVTKGNHQLSWGYGVPYVGSKLELASLAAFNAGKDKLYISERDGERMRTHARRMTDLVPGIKIYQTQGGDTSFLEVALTDLPDLSQAGAASTDAKRIVLGLVPQYKADNTRKLSDDLVLHPIDLAFRGMVQTWQLTRPAGFPMGGDDKQMRPSVPEAVEAIKGVQLSNQLGLSVVAPQTGDVIKTAITGYKNLATTYGNKAVTGAKKEHPLATVGVEQLRERSKTPLTRDLTSSTFLDELFLFESKLYKGLIGGDNIKEGDPAFQDDQKNVSVAVRTMAQAISDGEGIWMLYLQKPDKTAPVEDHADAAITHRLYIKKHSVKDYAFTGGLQSMLQLEPGRPFPLFIPAMYSPLLEKALNGFQDPTTVGDPSGTLVSLLSGGKTVALHYHDVLWVGDNGEGFTGADLVAASLRFSMLLMYLLTFTCLNDQVFNDLIGGFKKTMGDRYDELSGAQPTGEAQEAKTDKDKAQDKLAKIVAGMVHSIEQNKAAVMDQCWMTPFFPLRAFVIKDPAGNFKDIDAIGKTLVTEMGLGEGDKEVFMGFGDVALAEKLSSTAFDKERGTEKPRGQCGWGEWLWGGIKEGVTMGMADSVKCKKGWEIAKVIVSIITVAALIYMLANLGVFGKKGKKAITGKGGGHKGAPAAGGGGQAAPPTTKNPYEKREIKKI